MGEGQATSNSQGLEAWRVIATIPEFPLIYGETALLVIDLTIGQIARDGDRYTRIREAGMAEDAEYAYGRVEELVVPNTRRLVDAFHEANAPVIFTTCASRTGGGSDQMSPRGHQAALHYLDRNFCHVKSTDEILARLASDSADADSQTS